MLLICPSKHHTSTYYTTCLHFQNLHCTFNPIFLRVVCNLERVYYTTLNDLLRFLRFILFSSPCLDDKNIEYNFENA